MWLCFGFSGFFGLFIYHDANLLVFQNILISDKANPRTDAPTQPIFFFKSSLSPKHPPHLVVMIKVDSLHELILYLHISTAST